MFRLMIRSDGLAVTLFEQHLTSRNGSELPSKDAGPADPNDSSYAGTSFKESIGSFAKPLLIRCTKET